MDAIKVAVIAVIGAVLASVGYVFYVPVTHDLEVGDVTILSANDVGDADVANGVMAVATHYYDLQEAMEAANGS